MDSRALRGRRPAFETLERRAVPSGFHPVARVRATPAPAVQAPSSTAVDTAYLGTDVTDPTIIKDGDTYYLFTTGPGIPARSSTDLVHWQDLGPVFDALPAWAVQKVPGATEPWAPDISYFDGQYHLYYAVSTFGSQRSVIALATNTTLDPDAPDYQWVDRGEVLESAPGRSIFNAIDPNLVLDDSGRPWLAFGSQWSGIKLAPIDPTSGKLAQPGRPFASLASRPASGPIEAASIVHANGYYYLFVSFDVCCMGSASTYRVMVGRSRRVAGPYLDRSGRPMLQGGGTPVLVGAGRYRGPGSSSVLIDGSQAWIVNHAYDAAQGGNAKLQVRPLSWDAQGWPVAGAPVAT
jgi:arabinan endo-1,5-alpha-L-arabinosidase